MPSLSPTSDKSQRAALLYRAAATARIKTFGAQLVVQRKAATLTASPTSQTLWCIPITDSRAQEEIASEGDMNAANAKPMTFLFQAVADVREDVDRVIYEGWYYKLTSVYPTGELSGLVLSWTARAVRDGKVAG